ncbi:hypothetical protein DL95DRAFT_479517 [Leptodontidium sp. 2 PMI_412]|nr:hypothetical protein DL95DRAFT_479517 [Leptodontidium sp. 2 PMI_412]
MATTGASNSTVSTNSTLPAHARFVSSPNSRGTLDILWSSLFTIIACTWTVQHLNVPPQRNTCRPGWQGSLKWHTQRAFTNVKWMLITMIAPEVVIGMACYDYLSAKKNLRDLEEFASMDGVPWTLTHSFYANMGGFANRSSIPSVIFGTDGEIAYHTPYHLTGRQIWQLRKIGILSSLPQVSEAELKDRSKSDAFVKSIALFQIFWAVVHIIIRAVRKLTISQLEVAVIAFAACAVVIYGLHWSKPKSVEVPTTILQYEGPIPQGVLELIKGRHTYIGYLLKADDSRKFRHGSPIRNDATENYLDSDAGFWVYPAMILGAMLFGGMHLWAWNFDFPTRIELLIWRCGGVWTTVWGPSLILLGLLLGRFEQFEVHRIVIIQILTFCYIVARLALLVEGFRTLFFLPDDAFISTWASEIPHVG